MVELVSPLVSLIVPNFNQPRAVVAACLDSVAAQTLVNFECIVVDDSTDPAAAAECRDLCARDPRFRYIHPPTRLGLAASLNLGISVARGRYLARFDSDDICAPDRLAIQSAFLDENPAIGIVGSWIQIIDDAGTPRQVRRYPTNHEAIVRQFVYTNAVAHPTVMLPRTTLSGVHGPYDVDFRYCEDLELWLKLLSRGIEFANIPRVLVSYRQEDPNRPFIHWQYNIKARRKYLVKPSILEKCAVIVLLSLWRYTPRFLQNIVYRKSIFGGRARP